MEENPTSNPEKLLLQSKVDFNRIEEITNIGSFVWDLQEDFLICTPNLLKIINGNPNDKKLNKSVFFELIDAHSRNFVLDVMQECIVTNDEFEVTFLTQGDAKKLRLLGYPEGDNFDKRIIGLIQDLSDYEETNDALLKGQDDERKRISLELHDSVGQKLIAAKYQFALYKVDPSDGKYQKLDELINQIISEIRGITHNLSSQVVSEVGLRNAIGHLLNDTCEFLNAKKRYRYELKNASNEDLRLNDDAAKMIYRILQEAFANIAKHSKASLIELTLIIINNQIIVNLTDNGKGMSFENKQNSGIGIRNIKERVAYLNGFVRITSSPGNGVEINIKIPLRNVLAQ